MSIPPGVLEAQRSTSAPSWRRRMRRFPDSNPGTQDDGEDPDGTKYGDTSATYWKLYGSEAEINDKKYVESLTGDTNSMVILNTLFSAIIASFIIEIYKTLLPPANVDDQSFHPSSVAIRINIVLFISFFLSITSAVACALIQQWCREYMEHAYPRAAPHECGRIRTYLFRGLNRFQMRRFMYGTHVLLHMSLFLFFWAISDFFYTVHTLVGAVSRYCLVAAAAVYMALSIFPLIFSDSPYNTPLTNPLRAGGMLLLYGFRIVPWYLRKWRGHNEGSKLTRRAYFQGIRFNRSHLLSLEADNRAADLERYAMEWLFKENDFSDRDMDKFLEGLPGYISSCHTKKDKLDTYITSDYILDRTKEHFLTCATSSELSDEESIFRVLHCVESLRLIFRRSAKSDQNHPNLDNAKLEPQQTYIEAIIHNLQILCEREDPAVALRASCIRALAVHGLLTQITSEVPDRPFPKHLIPLYMLFFPHDTQNATAQPDVNSLSGDDKRMWKDLLSDGPLVNLTMLAEAVRQREHVSPSSLSFCWKTLDILFKQLEIGLSEASLPTLNRFNNMHESTRGYVQKQELGFRIAPLLEILDAVARGRRLSLVFLEHPEYHSRADVIFGKERLWKGDLLEACARCLPDYISKISTEKGMEFMEGIVRDDDLWASLQLNLWNAQRSYRLTPDKLRIFADCCTVLDVAFSSLENSTKVDWRAPEFGSLAQQFESFIAHCFQGSFMGRATSLCVGTIRAQCCKALLAQFCNDVDRDGTVFLRSQWDVASLARLFWTLEIGGKEDAEFWKCYTNGGHIGPDFTTKARETISRAARDGPLLIFCKLGRLAMTAVPLRGSGLEAEDLTKVWKLQRNMIEDQRLPLNHASEKVWEKLGRLRADISRLCSNMPSEDQERLRPLLEMMDEVHRLNSKELSSSEDAERQSPVTPTLPLREQRRNVNRRSVSSESTAVSDRRSSVTQVTQTCEGSLGERSSDAVSDSETNTPASSSSSHSNNAGFYSFASPYITQGIPAGGVMDLPISTGPLCFSPVNPGSYIPYMAHKGQRRDTLNDPPSSHSGSGVSAPRATTATRIATLPKSSRTVSAIPPDSAISSLYGSSNFSDSGQYGTSANPNFGVSENE